MQHTSPKPSKSLIAARRKWVGACVRCYARSMKNAKLGPYEGVVKAVSDSQFAAEYEGSREYSGTGLLVDIPDLGRNPTFGEWPVRFSDASILESRTSSPNQSTQHTH